MRAHNEVDILLGPCLRLISLYISQRQKAYNFTGLFISCTKKSEFDDLLEIDEEPTFLKIKKEFDFILNDYLVHRDTIRHKDNFVKVWLKPSSLDPDNL